MSRRRPGRPLVAKGVILALVGVVVLIAMAFSRGGTGINSIGTDATGLTATGLTATGLDGTGTSAPDATAAPDTAAPGTAAPGTPAPGTPALALLATLSIKGRAPETGYNRTNQFGQAWIDTDHNGCDTRDDILARDLTSITRATTCKVLSGVLVDPYTGATINFVRGNTTSTAVQIDHVVPLLDAWEKGAQQLSAGQRVAFANDPRNLLAVGGAINDAKGAGDAATWLPPNKSFRCSYVSRQIVVKAAYQLWVTQAEHDAMARVLAACGG